MWYYVKITDDFGGLTSTAGYIEASSPQEAIDRRLETSSTASWARDHDNLTVEHPNVVVNRVGNPEEVKQLDDLAASPEDNPRMKMAGTVVIPREH